MRLPAPMRSYLGSEGLTVETGAAALRIVFVVLFGGQVALALALGLLVGGLLPQRQNPNDFFAFVLVAFGAFQVPLGYVLSTAASRAGGREAALAATVLAAVVCSVPAYIATLMLISPQRPLFLFVVLAVLGAGYGLGFLATNQAARAATLPTPGTRTTP
jgi:nitrate/nitrite transporter NarK